MTSGRLDDVVLDGRHDVVGEVVEDAAHRPYSG